MLKRILLLIAVCLVLFSPMVVFAEGNSETTTQIDEEKTPEAARKKEHTEKGRTAGENPDVTENAGVKECKEILWTLPTVLKMRRLSVDQQDLCRTVIGQRDQGAEADGALL